ncbi:MAG: tetratricopeptide repeat protein [Elusimicrobiota bacterium]
MVFLIIIISFLLFLLAWAVLFRTQLIYKINEWFREQVFNDRWILFSGRRVAILLLFLGGIALFSGLSEMIKSRNIPPAIARQMLEQAQKDLSKGEYLKVVHRCRDLVRSDQRNVDAWELFAIASLALGDKDQARVALNSISRVDPNYDKSRLFSTLSD